MDRMPMIRRTGRMHNTEEEKHTYLDPDYNLRDAPGRELPMAFSDHVNIPR